MLIDQLIGLDISKSMCTVVKRFLVDKPDSKDSGIRNIPF